MLISAAQKTLLPWSMRWQSHGSGQECNNNSNNNNINSLNNNNNNNNTNKHNVYIVPDSLIVNGALTLWVPTAPIHALRGRALCTTFDVINLNATRYSWYASRRARIDLSAPWTVFFKSTAFRHSKLKNNVISLETKMMVKLLVEMLIIFQGQTKIIFLLVSCTRNKYLLNDMKKFSM